MNVLQCLKHIFTAPASARETSGYHKGRATNAQIAGMMKTTPHAVAYAACQVSDVERRSETEIITDPHYCLGTLRYLRYGLMEHRGSSLQPR